MGQVSTIYNNDSTDLLNTLYSIVANRMFVDTGNTVTAVESATLQGYTGTVFFTKSIADGDIEARTLTNALITPDSILELSTKYDTGNDGYPDLLFYSCYSGYAQMYYKNEAGDPLGSSIEVSFRIVNN